MIRPAFLLALPALLCGQTPGAITLEGLAHPQKRVAYVGNPTTRLEWAPDGSLVETKADKGQASLWRVDPQTWEKKPFFEGDRLVKALVAAGAKEGAASRAFSAQPTWSPDRKACVVGIEEDLYYVDLAKAEAKRLTTTPGSEDEASFSPDGTKVAFLRGNDLYVVTVADAKETRLTTGGSETVFNGRLDWVYQEEVYGRGDFKAFWWSTDSSKLAYLSLDETQVPVFTLADDRSQPQKLLQARYPKAGDPNPITKLGVVDLQGHTTWMADPYAGKETLIVQVSWTPKGDLIAAYQDRVQTWLDLRRFTGTASTTLIREESKAWQERLPLPMWLPDGGFVWESDRSGFHHLYRYGKDGQLRNAITSGDWDVKHVHGVSADGKKVYFDATARSPIGLDTYVVPVEGMGKQGKDLKQLTQARGTHRVRWNKDFSLFLDTWSNAEMPAKQALFHAAGNQARMIDENPSPMLKDLKLGTLKFQKVPTRDGFPMETMLVLPPDFDAKKKYPVFQHIYGGPAAPQVKDAFGRDLLWFHFLAQQGYVVWVCDNRSASAKGNAAFGIYKRMGEQELQDQLDGLKWLEQQGWADMSRMALEGWSYGGYMTAYGLTHSKAWKIGFVGAPVTSWKLYDSIYTERYMGLPSENKDGYESTNLCAHAKDLAGKILIMHGTLDDNVHPQNTIQFIDALQKGGQDYDLRLFPGSDHGPRAPWQIWNRQKAMWEFLQKNL